jgi:hypothetical protein
MDGAAVIAAYHDLWKVEQSFRMTKGDLRARPAFHHQREAIEAHLAVVFAVLAVARHLQDANDTGIKKIVQTLRTARSATIEINGQRLTLDPDLTDTRPRHPQAARNRSLSDWHEPGQTTRRPTPAPWPRELREVASRILTMPGTRSDDDQASMESILAASPEPAAHTDHLRGRAKLMTARGGRDLDRWMAVATVGGEPALQSFVTGLRVDGDAVTAGFTLSWSSGSARATSTSSRCSNARWTDAPTPTCSVASSSANDVTKMCQSQYSAAVDKG